MFFWEMMLHDLHQRLQISRWIYPVSWYKETVAQLHGILRDDAASRRPVWTAREREIFGTLLTVGDRESRQFSQSLKMGVVLGVVLGVVCTPVWALGKPWFGKWGPRGR